jgi:ketosteroid isomerase-like protein
MRWGLIVIGIVSLAACQVSRPADAADTAGDLRQIEALYASWREAVETGNIAQYVAVLHPQVRLLPPGAEAIVSAAGYGRFLEPVFASADYRIEVIRPPQFEILGDVAVAEYEYVIHLTLKDPGSGITEPGALTAERTAARYFDVLRRLPDGQWRVWRHMWHDRPGEGS